MPCARYEGEPMGQCDFGVKRLGAGAAEVTIFWPDGSTRIVVFEDGAVASSDAGEELRATKEADLFLVTIGFERFEIPEAVPFGG